MTSSIPGTARAARNARTPARSAGRRWASRSGMVPAVGAPLGPRAATPAQVARGRCVDLPDGVVELADAGEASREGDLGDRQVGGLEQEAGRVRALRAGQGERSRADFGDQGAMYLPFAVSEPCGEAATPSRSTIPSVIRRIARPTKSARTFHSGDLGSRRAGNGGRHGSQLTGPALRSGRSGRSARLGVLAGQLGRQ